MKSIRLYIDQKISQNTLLILNQEQSHYIANVMRCRGEEKIKIFNSIDGEWSGEVRIEKKDVLVRSLQHLRHAESSNQKLILCFAPTKKYGEFVVEKATELGVDHIIPILTRRSVVNRVNLQRYEKAAIEASEQCGRISLPKISNMTDVSNLPEIVKEHSGDVTYIVCDCSVENYITPRELSSINTQATVLIIGPEGGFDECDRENFVKYLIKPIYLKIGDLTMRSETAAIVALSLSTNFLLR